MGSITEIDAKGGQTITIDMRGQSYTVDQILLQQLVLEGKEILAKEKNK